MIQFLIMFIVIFLDFHSTKKGLPLFDSWSRNIISRPLLWYIHRQSDCIHGEQEVRLGSPETVVIYFASIKYHLKKHCQSIATPSQPFCLVTQWERASCDKTKRLRGGPIPYELGRLFCRHERCFHTKKLKKCWVTKQRTAAQKSWMGLTCRHNHTKFWYCY